MMKMLNMMSMRSKSMKIILHLKMYQVLPLNILPLATKNNPFKRRRLFKNLSYQFRRNKKRRLRKKLMNLKKVNNQEVDLESTLLLSKILMSLRGNVADLRRTLSLHHLLLRIRELRKRKKREGKNKNKKN